MHILQIHSSIRGSDSQSNRLAAAIVDKLTATRPQARIIVRDLAQDPHPMLDAATLQALSTPAEQRSRDQIDRVALDDKLINELQAADTLVLGVPMYNFGIPATLKNWIDAICRAQVTFRYTEHGPEGLLTGKRVYVALARGGIHRDSPADSQTIYLQTVLNFLGMNDVHFVYAEGLAMGEDAAQLGYRQALAEIDAALR